MRIFHAQERNFESVKGSIGTEKGATRGEAGGVQDGIDHVIEASSSIFLLIKLNACSRTPLVHVDDIISLYLTSLFQNTLDTFLIYFQGTKSKGSCSFSNYC